MSDMHFYPSSGTKIHSIPPAPLSEEELRLECVRLAVDWTVNIMTMTTTDLLHISKEIEKYVRPTK